MWGRTPSACSPLRLEPVGGLFTCLVARLIGPQRDGRLRILKARLHQREPSHAATTPCPQRPWLVHTCSPQLARLYITARHRDSARSSARVVAAFCLLLCCASISSFCSCALTQVSLSPHTRIEQLSAPTAFTLGPVEKVGAYD
jgi:hypothetical protein